MDPCFRYLADTLLIPSCNVGLQEGIRRVSGGYQKMGQNRELVMAGIHLNKKNLMCFVIAKLVIENIKIQ